MKLSLHRPLLFLLSLVSASAWAQAPSAGILWARQLKGQYEATILKMEIDPSGNMIVAGNFIDVADFDMGPGQMTKAAGAYQDFYVAKYSPYGSLLWVSSFDGLGVNDQLDHLLVHPNGMVTITGEFDQSIDADPGPGQAILTGTADLCMITLDGQGQLVSANSWVTTNTQNSVDDYTTCLLPSGNILLVGTDLGGFDLDPSPASMLITNVPNNAVAGFIVEMTPLGALVRAEGFRWNSTGICDVICDGTNLILSGTFSGSFDADPGALSFQVTAGATNSAYICWLDYTTLNLQKWQQLGGNGNSFTNSMHQDNFGTVLWGVSFSNTVDIDPDLNGTNPVTAAWGLDAVLFAFGSNGTPIWNNLMAGNGNDEIQEIDSDPAGNVYIGGTLHGTLDFDGGALVQNLTANGNRDGYLACFLPAGQLLWTQQVGTANDDYGNAIELDANANVYLSGKFIGTGDFDPGTSAYSMVSSGTYDAFIAKYAQGACMNLGAYTSNVTAVPCGGTGNASILATGGAAPYSFVWDNGSTSNTISSNIAGLHSVTVTDAAGCTVDRLLYLPGVTTQTQYDLEFAVLPQVFRPNIPAVTSFRFLNSACVPVNAHVSIELDIELHDILVSMTPDSIVGRTYHFSLPNMTNGVPVFIDFRSRPSTILSPTEMMSFKVAVTPDAGDFTPANNARDYDFPVVNSYDPNDKQVFPAGACHQKYVDKDEVLTYTIRFQNTGTAEAYNIYLLDSLDPAFDLSTLRVVDNSHAMITEVLPGNVLKFRFDNIMLPDSNANEALSHGHVVYTIKATAGTPDLTSVHNRGDIYFDWNPPVLTNTTNNTLIEVVPACSTTTALVQPGGSLSIYPNPSRGSFSVEAAGLQHVEVYTLSGQRILIQAATSGMAKVQLPANTAAGLYLLKGQGENGISVQRILVE